MTLLFFPLLTISVHASGNNTDGQGSIQILFEDDGALKEMNENVIFYLSKVGEYENGEYYFYPSVLNTSKEVQNNLNSATIDDFVNELKKSIEPDFTRDFCYDIEMKFENLDNGLYLMYAEAMNSDFTFEPAFLTIPYFDEDSKEMINEVQVYPKYIRNDHKEVIPPNTGDEVDYKKIIVLGVSSILSLCVLTVVLIKSKIYK